jgi:hypothetical protein
MFWLSESVRHASHDFADYTEKQTAGAQASEATPSFGRLCPGRDFLY